ncbi:hypothetical protein [Pelobacter propionicus]|jgi:hypothetical protein|uniref:Uncharacterized protein n=1 Tax=Pelobacter propionicus (strain DSM 2379 / NBRC 103807 / OttBd1) TaxID=338966 RepID=A0R7P7_PELPD|nr:hypothetical protein [Pelobacter propionicus]ABL01355.1 hypothetical protein Ppro_3766 [Pelobacter propionicus DSM 2379]
MGNQGMGKHHYPFKYVVMDDGIQALVWALDGPIKVSRKADCHLVNEGVLAVAGEVALPIHDDLLKQLIESPRVLVTFLTDRLVDHEHVLVEMDLPKLYEMKGALAALKQTGAIATS